MDHLAKLAFVLSQLGTYAGAKKTMDGSTFVACPFHSESTPSFRIFHTASSRSPGFGKCYGCGATAPWNEHAPKLGLKPWAYAKPSTVFASALRIEERVEEPEEELTYSDLPAGKVWRGIKTDFLREVGCRKVVNQWGRAYVYLPVFVLGTLRGYIKAQLRKQEGAPSYINKKGKWSLDYGLFLYDYVAKQKPTVLGLVEGPRDGLRMNYLGIPVLSILGTQSWSDRKSRLIELMGVTDVVLIMDGDCAGLAAVELIEPKLSKFVKVHVFSLTGPDSPYYQFRHEAEPTKAAKAAGVSLWDPGNMPLSKAKELKTLFRQLAH
jgi:hypothetical protein